MLRWFMVPHFGAVILVGSPGTPHLAYGSTIQNKMPYITVLDSDRTCSSVEICEVACRAFKSALKLK